MGEFQSRPTRCANTKKSSQKPLESTRLYAHKKEEALSKVLILQSIRVSQMHYIRAENTTNQIVPHVEEIQLRLC